MRAFTLVEAMIVVAILGIAAALAVPRLLPEIHKAQLNGDTEIAANFLARARAEAMDSKRCVRVHLGAASAGNINDLVDTVLSAERLNSFNCDSDDSTVAAVTSQKIDTTTGVWIPIDTVHTSSAAVQYVFQTAIAAPDNALLPPNASTSTELRFRPNGRVYLNQTLSNTPNLSKGDAILTVRHNLIINQSELANAAQSGRRHVLVQSNGLICTLPRGFAPTAVSQNNTTTVVGTQFLCP